VIRSDIVTHVSSDAVAARAAAGAARAARATAAATHALIDTARTVQTFTVPEPI
jgi:hypothetical protein